MYRESERLGLSTAGSADRGRWFPDEDAHELYWRIYSSHTSRSQLSPSEQQTVDAWIEPGLVAYEGERISPLMPVMTPADAELLEQWFDDATDRASQVVRAKDDAYRQLASDLADGSVPDDYIRTILICAYTLDVGTLAELQNGAMGAPPHRADAGACFLWGSKTTSTIPRVSFGVNSNGTDDFMVRFIHSGNIVRSSA